MKKRVLSAVLVLALVMQLLPSAFALDMEVPEEEVISETEEIPVEASEPESDEAELLLPEESESVEPEEEIADEVISEEAELPAQPEEDPEAIIAPEEAPDRLPEEEVLLPEEEEAEEVEETVEEEPVLYNGYEADYEDPTFLRMLENGSFDEASAIDSAPAYQYTHDSRFDGYTVTKGVDISKWNTITSWGNLAKSVDFAIIRAAYRSTGDGSLHTDPVFHSYMSSAQKAGLKVGVYFFSQAINESEARAEANYILNLCQGYDFELPVVLDFEYYAGGRLSNAHLSKDKQTKICKAFCEVVEKAGYDAMVYANKTMLTNDLYGQQLADAGYEIWLAQWTNTPTYAGTYTYWQYGDNGVVSGIQGTVDVDFRYSLPCAKLRTYYNTANGVRIYWDAVAASDKYQIYRKAAGETRWTLLGTVSKSESTYLDKTAVSGKTYQYCIGCVDGVVTSHLPTNGTSIVYQPALSVSTAVRQGNSVVVSWKKIGDYSCYRVFRRPGTSGTWQKVGIINDPSVTSFTDTTITDAKPGDIFSYTIVGYHGTEADRYDSYGVQVIWLETPVLKSADPCATGMKVQWTAVSGAEGYYVSRKNNGKWTKIGTVSSASTTFFVDTDATEEGSTYLYTVRAYQGGNMSGYDSNGVSGILVPRPVLTGAATQGSSIKVQWKAVDGASRYRLYRKEGEKGNYTAIATLTDTVYTDSDVKAGVVYTYTVRANEKSWWSWFDENGVSMLLMDTPKLSGASSSASGIALKWDAVSGAHGYRIYRKTADTNWKQIGTSLTNSYTDSSALTNNTAYSYTVRAYYKSTSVLLSSYDTKGVTFYYLDNPVLSGAVNYNGGVKVTWKGVTGADHYRIYRKTAKTSWTLLTTVGKVSSYVDTSAVSGNTYSYTVRAVKNSCTGWFDGNGVSVSYLAAPVLKGAVWCSAGVNVTWDAVAKAESYNVYRKEAGGSWKLLTSTTKENYVDTSALSEGKTYLYTVRALSGSLLSSFDSAGAAYFVIPVPTMTSYYNSLSGVSLRWTEVAQAESYSIYRKSGSASWTKIATISGKTSYVDDTAESGTLYTYTVRAVVDGKTGDFVKEGYSVLFLSAPVLKGVRQSDKGVSVSWQAVPGAEGYRIYRKSGSGSPVQIAVSKSTTYTDTAKLSAGTNYTYLVRAYSGSALSAYDSAGKTLTYK